MARPCADAPAAITQRPIVIQFWHKATDSASMTQWVMPAISAAPGRGAFTVCGVAVAKPTATSAALPIAQQVPDLLFLGLKSSNDVAFEVVPDPGIPLPVPPSPAPSVCPLGRLVRGASPTLLLQYQSPTGSKLRMLTLSGWVNVEISDFPVAGWTTADTKSGQDSRIAGIWTLADYWHDSDFSGIVANTLAAILVTDADDATLVARSRAQRVREAAAEVIGLAYDTKTPKDEQVRLRTLLYGNSKTGELGAITRYQQELASEERASPSDQQIQQKLQATRETELGPQSFVGDR
jgi:hypothetical protein